MPIADRIAASGGAPVVFGRYQLERELGQGGMGAVFLATDSVLRRKVAIKIPFLTAKPEAAGREREAVLARFRREALAIAALDHPNICAIHDVGEIEGQPYLAMTYVNGRPLSAFVKGRGGLPVRTALQIVHRLAKTLDYAHGRGVLHRDLKPANIMINDRREPIVMDFGLARCEGADDEPLTRTGEILGTPAFMPPEQLSGRRDAMGPWSDVYSLGMVLYESLTGRRAFSGDVFQLIHQIGHEPPPPPSAHRPELDAELDELVLKSLEKDPQRRYRSMRDFAAAVAACLEQTVSTRTVPAANKSPFTNEAPLENGRADVSRTTPGSNPFAILVEATAVVGLTGKTWSGRGPFGRGMLPGLAVAAVLLLLGTGAWLLNARPWSASPPARDGGAGARGSRSPVGQRKPAAPARPSKDERPAPAPAATSVTETVPSVERPAFAHAPFDGARAKALQEQWAAYLKVPVEFSNSAELKFRLIPPGTFLMGAGPGDLKAIEAMRQRYPGPPDETEVPQRPVAIRRPFYLGVHEVTQKGFEHVMGRNPSSFSARGGAAEGVEGLETAQFPVETVSRDDVAEFCEKLSLAEMRTPVYVRKGHLWEIREGTGYRVPSEAEWEYACRAGTTTAYWSGDSEEVASQNDWTGQSPGGKVRAHAVGDLKANPFGLFDMHGNVFELCQDCWDPQAYRQKPMPAGTAFANPGVSRGGNYIFSTYVARSSCRRAMPVQPMAMAGFRLLLPISEAPEFDVPLPRDVVAAATLPSAVPQMASTAPVKPAPASAPATQAPPPSAPAKPTSPKTVPSKSVSASPPIRSVMARWPGNSGPLAPKNPLQKRFDSRPEVRIDHYTLTPMFDYELEALVVAKRYYPQKEWSDFFPWDIGVAWGRMSDPQLLRQVNFRQEKRFLNWSSSNLPLPASDIKVSLANIHAVPASDSISQQLDALPVGAVVSMKGQLVTLRASRGSEFRILKSSTSRSDAGEGACEVLYVTELRSRLPNPPKAR